MSIRALILLELATESSTFLEFPPPSSLSLRSIKLYYTWGCAYPIRMSYAKKEGFLRTLGSDSRAMGRFVEAVFYDFSVERSYRMGT